MVPAEVMSTLLESQVFLFSSTLDQPDQFFQGYCFKGNDFIFGQGGAEARLAQTGEEIGAGEDGCYISVTRDGDNYVFRTDFSGNKKLFYYWDMGFWAVSNSLPILINHIQSNSIPVAPNYAQLAAAGFGKGSSALNQLTSYQTVANGIKLTPIKMDLVIGKRRIEFRPSYQAENLDYRSALSRYLHTWIARLRTLLDEPGMSVNCDLTGGMDSRAVFAMLMRARSENPTSPALIRVGSAPTKGLSTDMDIASEISERYDLRINGPRPASPHRFSREESYASWRQLCLGSYFPIYFPGIAPYSHRVSLGGGGGENHRRFYPDASADALTASRAARIKPSWLRSAFVADMASTFRTLERIESPDTDPLVLHYRHFRNRLHSGRTPQYGVQFMPLGSRLLEEAANAAGKVHQDRGQRNYDIIHSTEPDLLSVRFDQPYKSPTDDVIEALTRIDIPSLRAGRVYHEPPMQPSHNGGTSSQWRYLQAELRDAVKSSFVQDFWPPEFLTDAQKTADGAVAEARLPHPIDGQPISAILTSTMF